MKKLFAFYLACAVLALAACATAPGAAQVQQIQTSCAVDAGLRPTVDVLLAVPGLATAEEVAAIGAARAVIDPICANPAGSVQANALAAFSGATVRLVNIAAQLQSRAPVK